MVPDRGTLKLIMCERGKLPRKNTDGGRARGAAGPPVGREGGSNRGCQGDDGYMLRV